MGHQAANGPLTGLKVVEFQGIGPGPHVAMMLADLGAEVVRIERPGHQPMNPVVERARHRAAVDLKSDEGKKFVLEALKHGEERRHEQHGQAGRGDHAAEHAEAQRDARVGARPGRGMPDRKHYITAGGYRAVCNIGEGCAGTDLTLPHGHITAGHCPYFAVEQIQAVSAAACFG